MPKITKSIINNKSIGVIGINSPSSGFILSSDIPGSTTSNTSLFPMQGNSNDSYGSRNLTNINSVQFNSNGILNTNNIPFFNGINQRLSSTDSFFNMASAQRIFAGGWFKASKWTNTTGDVAKFILNIGNNTDNIDPIQIFHYDNYVQFRISNGSTTSSIIAKHNWQNNSWHHIAFLAIQNDGGSGRIIAFLDGNRVGNVTIATGISTTASNLINIASRRNLETANIMFTGSVQEVFFSKSTDITTSNVNEIIKNIYQKRFNGRQLSGGHILQANSFPIANLANKVAFWNLNSTTTNTDGSGNGKTLNYVGTVNSNVTNYTGLNIFGEQDSATLNGTSNRLARNDSFFNTAGRPYTMGGWFALDRWDSGIEQAIFALGDMGDFENPFQVFTYSDGNGIIYRIGSGSINFDMKVPYLMSQFNGKFIHLAFRYDSFNMSVFLNGELLSSVVPTIKPNSGVVTNLFSIGARRDVANSYMAGRVQDVFFVRDIALTDQDIKKLYSARIDLTPEQANTPVESRTYELRISNEDGIYKTEVLNNWLIDHSSDKLWVDFGSGENGEKITLRIK
jgi:hypothetical protein